VGLSPTGTFAIELGNYKPTHGTIQSLEPKPATTTTL
jgi:hypothetical protein